MEVKRAYSTKEVCERYGVHPNTVRKMVRDGRLKGQKTADSTRSPFRFAPAECDRAFLGIKPEKTV